MNSLSTFATTVARELGSSGTAMNGWDVVRYQDVPMKVYRQQFRDAFPEEEFAAAPSPKPTARKTHAPAPPQQSISLLDDFLGAELAKFELIPPTSSPTKAKEDEEEAAT